MRLARRSALGLLGSSALAGFIGRAGADGKSVTVGINLPLTGASAETRPPSCTARCWRSGRGTPRAVPAAMK
jgi:hypothetical protein